MTAKPEIPAIVDWLIDGAHSASTPDGVLAQLCNRLVDARVPLWRGAVFVRTLHPQILGRKIEWRAGIGATISEAPFGIFDTTAFQGSPVARVYEEVRAIYLRLDKDVARTFPQLEGLRAEGATAYLALPLPFSNGEVHVATWATRQSGRFSDQQVAALETINALSRVSLRFARCGGLRSICSIPTSAMRPVRASWRVTSGAALARRYGPQFGFPTCAGLQRSPTACRQRR